MTCRVSEWQWRWHSCETLNALRRATSLALLAAWATAFLRGVHAPACPFRVSLPAKMARACVRAFVRSFVSENCYYQYNINNLLVRSIIALAIASHCEAVTSQRGDFVLRVVHQLQAHYAPILLPLPLQG